jgi:hypothetical protein
MMDAFMNLSMREDNRERRRCHSIDPLRLGQ